MSLCPKCGYRRQAKDAQVHPSICPACGIAINKWRARMDAQGAADQAPGHRDVGRESESDLPQPFLHRLQAHFMWVAVPSRADSIWGRALLTGVLAVWGAWFALNGIDWQVIGGSFMHNINLPFHEFGHVLFMPFGRTMMILGGSLFQVLLPLIVLCVFSFKQQDNHAASVGLWWCGQSFVDLAPYIADAQYRILPLVGGAGEESHDWGNLLTQWGLLEYTQGIARASFGLGVLIMAVAIAWGIFLLRKQWHLAHEDTA
ncbi:hypothetical protein L1F30_17070 [Simiduia sp. 21SJ11W-1]|uniref:hypothetical protein n=1 Tax=Simiduia sp. 21SJ11W-1 TaxID=2909669 RepID=UPI0020A17A6C|nr:hypothetical protein [Simiduia sp. 21SJ11W-1]UTA47853.1 hypothetical protein L1F30_17070 [Simiduia sp. 21SJ11W-1]